MHVGMPAEVIAERQFEVERGRRRQPSSDRRTDAGGFHDPPSTSRF